MSTPPGVIRIPPGYEPAFHRTLGVQMGFGPNAEGVAWIDVDPEKHYGARWAHGGMVGALADIASGLAVGRSLMNAVNVIDGTIELKVNYLRKVVEGDLTATARVLHLGKRVAVTEVDLTNQGKLCAKAIASFMLRRELETPTDQTTS